jgi:hypothetical protein
MRHNSHTPATMAATMLSNRTVSYRVEPDIKPDMERASSDRDDRPLTADRIAGFR